MAVEAPEAPRPSEIYAMLCGGHLDGQNLKLIGDHKERDFLILPAFIGKSKKIVIDEETGENLKFFLTYPTVGLEEDDETLKPFKNIKPELFCNYQFDGRFKVTNKEKKMIRFFKYVGKQTKEIK